MKPPTLASLARRHQVRVAWLRQVTTGTLDDPVTVQAVREAAPHPHLWALVAPTIRNALMVPTVQIEALGGTLDDLLVEIAAHGLETVRASLDAHLEDRRDADADRGRRQHASTRTAARAKAAQARLQSQALEWQKEVEARRPGTTKAAVYARIERRVLKQPGTVKKAIARLGKRK